jgi:hypothetical protein
MWSFFCVLNKAYDKKTKAIQCEPNRFLFIPFTNLKKSNQLVLQSCQF